jgi:gp16 family phage-associated protein
MDAWAQEVKIALIRHGMSLSALATHLGVSQPQLSNVLAGKREGNRAMAEHVAALLGVPIDLWYAVKRRVPDDLLDRYGTEELARQFQRMREE